MTFLCLIPFGGVMGKIKSVHGLRWADFAGEIQTQSM